MWAPKCLNSFGPLLKPKKRLRLSHDIINKFTSLTISIILPTLFFLIINLILYFFIQNSISNIHRVKSTIVYPDLFFKSNIKRKQASMQKAYESFVSIRSSFVLLEFSLHKVVIQKKVRRPFMYFFVSSRFLCIFN